VFIEWNKAIGEGMSLVRDVITAAFEKPDIYAAIQTIAAARNGKEISPERLGRWLAQNKGSIVGNLTLVSAGMARNGLPFWQIKEC
jgi:hypothetical protein